MSSSQNIQPSVICAENIALLQFLHTVPVKPTVQSVDIVSKEDSQRSLPLELELQLTGVLAALSSLREDVLLTTAVAVREFRSSNPLGHPSLEILVAVNNLGPLGGDGYLKMICEGFRRILSVLAKTERRPLSRSYVAHRLRICQGHDRDLEHEIFTEIVSVCRERILSRLRFGKQKRAKQKPPLEKALNEMYTALSGREHGDVRVFLITTRRFVSALKDFSKHQVDEKLPGLVEEADNWVRVGDMTKHFSTIPSSTLDLGTYADYRIIIKKIAQYRTAARRLYRVSQRCPALLSASVNPVRLKSAAYGRPDMTGYNPSLSKTLDRVSGLGNKGSLAKTLCILTGNSSESAHKDFLDDTRQVIGASKIHAEIQVLAHLRSVPVHGAFVTRVVQSNKKACFLCSQLFALTGPPFMRKSHGRLYCGWRLPVLPAMSQLQLQLNHSLEDQARRSIALLQKKQRKIDLPYPYESSALTASEVAASEFEGTITDPAEPATVVGDLEQQVTGMTEELRNFEIPKRPEDESGEESSSAISEVDAAEFSPTHEAGIPVPPDSQDYRPPSTVAAGHTSLIYTFGIAEMAIQYSVGTNCALPTNPLAYRVRQLDDNEAAALSSQSIQLYRVIPLEKGSEITLQGDSPFYLDFGDTIAELVLYK